MDKFHIAIQELEKRLAQLDALIAAGELCREQFDNWEGPEEDESPRPGNGHHASISRNKSVRAYTALCAALDMSITD